jgi:hypothetical protein
MSVRVAHLRRLKSFLFPKTLRADGVTRLYNNSIEDFISQLHQNLESTQATLISSM